MLLLMLSSANAGSPATTGESRRIEVYPLSQNFYDVEATETLQQIVLQLLPNRPAQRAQLMRDIMQLNPSAFIGQNPGRLKANVRLWLPNNPPPSYPPPSTPPLESRAVQIDSFSWGQVIRRR